MILNCFESRFYHNVTLEWLAHCMGKTKASITVSCCALASGNTLFPDCAFFSVNLRSRSASEKLPFSSSSFGQRSGAYYKAQLGTRASYGSVSWCAPHWTRALVETQELNLSLRYLKLVIPSSPRDKSQSILLRNTMGTSLFLKEFNN